MWQHVWHCGNMCALNTACGNIYGICVTSVKQVLVLTPL